MIHDDHCRRNENLLWMSFEQVLTLVPGKRYNDGLIVEMLEKFASKEIVVSLTFCCPTNFKIFQEYLFIWPFRGRMA